MSNINIHKEITDDRHGRYVAIIEGIEGEAEITFTQRAANKISADHTGAPESLRGTGAAFALVEFMIADARENDFKIIALCPYVLAQYAKHPEWQDVFTSKPREKPRFWYW